MKGFVVVNVSITSPISIRFRPGGYIRCSFILSRFANQSQCFALIKVWQLNLMIFPMDHFSVTYSDSCMILPSNLYLLLSIMHYVSAVSCWKLYDLRTDELITIAGRFFFFFVFCHKRISPIFLQLYSSFNHSNKEKDWI